MSGLDFSYMVTSTKEKILDDAVEHEIEEMKEDLEDDQKEGHDAIVAYNAHLHNGGAVSFEVLEISKEEVSEDLALKWRWLFPLSIYKSIDVFQLSKRMPKRFVFDRVFIGGMDEMEANQRDFAEVLFNYGRAAGLESVSGELYAGALSGDPRAVKMYLEMMNLIGIDEIDQEEASLRKLMRVELKL